ncbi:MAG: peptide chain release factor 3, partial [Gammaproteobacteria bacterium]|nr:peptide chain release factor 3 [Gammaproteobacteria bacterium]
FINKMDRETREPIELLDEIELVLNIDCAPVTWPIGMGKAFKGIYHLLEDAVYLYHGGNDGKTFSSEKIIGLDNPQLKTLLGADVVEQLQMDVELVKGASHQFNREAFSLGQLTPVFFGSGINNFGIQQLLDLFCDIASGPQQRISETRTVVPNEPAFTGFIFKIQANMDPAHRDRIAFMRICSGQYKKGMKMYHVRLARNIQISNAVTFMAGDRSHAEEAYPGDIIGLHNHGTIAIGDTFSQGEKLKFTGIPHFAPELFKRVQLKDPLRSKALLKGLIQLSEEGAVQIFRPLNSNDLILGAVGILQFDVVIYRLKAEYNVDCGYEAVNVHTARWVKCQDEKMLADFRQRAFDNLAIDGHDCLTYIAPTSVNLQLIQERWPDIQFVATQEL